MHFVCGVLSVRDVIPEELFVCVSPEHEVTPEELCVCMCVQVHLVAQISHIDGSDRRTAEVIKRG